MKNGTSLAFAMILTLMAGTAATPVVAGNADAPRRLGDTRLSRVENDTDVLRFAKCKRGINAIQLRIERGHVEVEKLWVTYARGGVDRLDVRDRISQGKESRWIDLRGGERCLKSIGIVGDTELSLDQARVEIWGR
jgi:hypothetical protein